MIQGRITNKLDLAKLQADMTSLQETAQRSISTPTENGKTQFLDMMNKAIQEVNQGVKEGEKASMDLAAGKTSNIHETMLAVTKAELGFNMLVQMRNKVIEAYQEVMRMQV
ncbi:MAG: flagellar hook-basal body complex protein FliE [Silvanigrellaceae bacterium]|nr:flagellar hook-basal body complex protein FliE [Silvanigrellaceae bacterium]